MKQCGLIFLAIFIATASLLFSNESPLERANQLWWTGNFESSINLYKEAAQTPENKALSRIQLGALFRSIGDSRSSIAQYEDFFAQSSGIKSGRVHSNHILIPLAESYYYVNRLKEAEEIFQKALGFSPDDPAALFGLGRVLFHQKRLKEAQELFEKAATINTAFSGNFIFLAEIAREMGNLKEAILSYRRALQLDSQQAELIFLLGEAYQASGMFEDAFRQFHRLKNIDSENTLVLSKLEEVKPKLMRKEEEIITARSLDRFTPVSRISGTENIPLLRIGLNTIASGKIIPMKTLTLLSSHSFEVTQKGGQLLSGRPGIQYRIELRNAVVSLGEKGSQNTVRLPGSFCIESKGNPDGSFIIKKIEYARGFAWSGIEDRQYRGKIEVTVIGGGFRLVNELNLEEYLMSVVPSEMMTSFPVEALKAQAVIARSFALHRARFVRPHKENGFDLCDSQHCQVYKGVSNEWEKTTRTVTETRGEVLLANGQITSPLYHANCGGHTQSSRDLKGWGDLSYLSGVLDAPRQVPFPTSPAAFERWVKSRPPTYCSSQDAAFRWFRLLPAYFLEEKINRQHKIGTLLKITVLKRSPSGNTASVRVEGSEGTLVIEKEHEIRRLLGLGPLRSTLFWIETKYDERGRPQTFSVYGGGWGHGVGMCQEGAGGMAKEGFNYRQILTHYYKNVTLKKLEY